MVVAQREAANATRPTTAIEPPVTAEVSKGIPEPNGTSTAAIAHMSAVAPVIIR
jgi:hypothetical protein